MRLRRGLRSGETAAEERLPPCDGLQGLASVASVGSASPRDSGSTVVEEI